VFDNKECLIMDKLNKKIVVVRGEMTKIEYSRFILIQVTHTF
jgi:hypothetical protein